MRVTLVLPLPSESVGCFCKVMIKSKIDARERALELAIAYYNGIEGNRILSVVDTAKEFESYLIGGAELPETEVMLPPNDAAPMVDENADQVTIDEGQENS